MDHTPRFTQKEEPSAKRRQVRVLGRSDIGEVVDGGHNFGLASGIYCLGIHFPSTGECIYYDRNRVEYIDE